MTAITKLYEHVATKPINQSLSKHNTHNALKNIKSTWNNTMKLLSCIHLQINKTNKCQIEFFFWRKWAFHLPLLILWLFMILALVERFLVILVSSSPLSFHPIYYISISTKPIFLKKKSPFHATQHCHSDSALIVHGVKNN